MQGTNTINRWFVILLATLAMIISPAASAASAHSCCPADASVSSPMPANPGLPAHHSAHEHGMQHDKDAADSAANTALDQNCGIFSCATVGLQILALNTALDTPDILTVKLASPVAETAGSFADALSTPPPRFG